LKDARLRLERGPREPTVVDADHWHQLLSGQLAIEAPPQALEIGA
jgi:hypothetical protein